MKQVWLIEQEIPRCIFDHNKKNQPVQNFQANMLREIFENGELDASPTKFYIDAGNDVVKIIATSGNEKVARRNQDDLDAFVAAQNRAFTVTMLDLILGCVKNGFEIENEYTSHAFSLHLMVQGIFTTSVFQKWYGKIDLQEFTLQEDGIHAYIIGTDRDDERIVIGWSDFIYVSSKVYRS